MKTKASAVIAILCGLVCAAAVFLYMQAVQTEADAARAEAMERYGGEQIKVCVATRDIAPGEEISQANTTTREWLVDLLPAHACESFEDIDGKQVATSIVAGEVISMQRFEEEVARVMVPAGLQAVSVELGDAQAVAGLLQAGSIVDVYAAGTSTDLLVSQVLVTAIEQGATGSKRVTLAVAPEHVQQIIATTQQSSLYLVLPSKQGTGPEANQDKESAPADTESKNPEEEKPSEPTSDQQAPAEQEPNNPEADPAPAQPEPAQEPPAQPETEDGPVNEEPQE